MHPSWLSTSPGSPAFWLRTATADALPTLFGASLGEILAYFLFFGSQAVTLGLNYRQVGEWHVSLSPHW